MRKSGFLMCRKARGEIFCSLQLLMQQVFFLICSCLWNAVKLISERHWIWEVGCWSCPVFSNWSETRTVVSSGPGFVSLLLLLLQPGNHEHASDWQQASPHINKVWPRTAETDGVCSVSSASWHFNHVPKQSTSNDKRISFWNFTESCLSLILSRTQLKNICSSPGDLSFFLS